MLKRIAIYFKKNPSRLSGYIACIVIYVNKHFPQIPVDVLIPSIMIVIGSAEYAQRAEDRKTIAALYAENPPDVPDNEIIKKL